MVLELKNFQLLGKSIGVGKMSMKDKDCRSNSD